MSRSLLGTLGRRGFVRLAIPSLALAGTVGGALALGVVGRPSVTGVENTFGPVDEAESTIESELHLENTNPIGFVTDDLTLSYEIRMNELPMASGEREGLALDRGTSSVEFETALRNERIPEWWRSHVEAGERTSLSVHTDVRSSRFDRSTGTPAVDREIETDLIGSFDSTESRPIEADSPAVDDPVAYVEETTARWGELREESTPIEMEFLVYNPNAHPIVIGELGYEIAMNEVTVGEGRSRRP
jgi:LEA14-like dessication related protein